MDTLRISPKFTSRDWITLDQSDAKDWVKAAEIVRDRLQGRFLHFATICLRHEYSGFVVLSIDSLLAEAIQQFKEGIIDGRGKSKKLIERFLEGERFQPDFDLNARADYYTDIRCGLLHQAEAKRMWLIRRNQPALLQKVDGDQGYIIDVKRFHAEVTGSLNDYLAHIPDPDSTPLRRCLWQKMNHICSVRQARGALYEHQDTEMHKK